MKAPVNLKTSIKQAPPLEGSMTCELAFRTAATHYLHQLTAQHEQTAAGDTAALHGMRVAMARLRTTIALFSPMVAGDEQVRLAAELKWLRAHLGIVRDLDVALARFEKIKAAINDGPWKQKRAACQRHLTKALRSPRYRRLIEDITAWIERGDWSRKRTRPAAERRTEPVGEHCADQLQEWQKKLLKMSRKLKELGTSKRHRVRLANKRLSYAIEAAEKLAPPGEAPAREVMLKVLREAQKSLGQLNDDARRRALAAAFGDKADGSDLLLNAEQKKQLLRRATSAYDQLAALKPLKVA
jgi:CHAD domain-containing protein